MMESINVVIDDDIGA
jgi:hypothetical protein